MKNRTDATQSKLNDTLAKFQKLALIPAKQKILVLTDRGFYYAFREHLKYLTNNPQMTYFKSVYVSSTMGVGLKVDINSLNK